MSSLSTVLPSDSPHSATTPEQRFVLFQSLYEASQSDDNNWQQLVALLSKGAQAAQRAQLEDVAEQFSSGQQIVLDELRDGGVFREWELGFLQLGLAVGNLANVYQRLAEHYRMFAEFRRRLRDNAVFPFALLLLFALGTPLALWALGEISVLQAMAAAGLGLLPLGVAAAVACILPRAPGLARRISRSLYRLPGIGAALAQYQSYHFVNNLAACLGAGFQLPQALKQSARRMPDTPVKGQFSGLARQVEQGQRFSQALLDSGILKGVELPMMAAGADARQVPGQLSLAIHRACEQQLQFWAASLPYLLLGLLPYVLVVNAWFLLR